MTDPDPLLNSGTTDAEGGQGGATPEPEPDPSRAELAQLEQATRNGWPIDLEKIAGQVARLTEKGSPRNRMAAIRVAVALSKARRDEAQGPTLAEPPDLSVLSDEDLDHLDRIATRLAERPAGG